MENRRKEILESCNRVIEGIENNSIDGNSAALLCKKIARLSNDDDAFTWLSYETSGYPRGSNGYIESDAWKIGAKHGRKYLDGKKNECIFLELISELEASISSINVAIQNFSTTGASFSGDKALLASRSFITNVHNSTVELVKAAEAFSRKKSILINEYYNYALIKQIEIKFEKINSSIFERYQKNVDSFISSINDELFQKIKSINFAMERDDVEAYSQALTSCRKLFYSFSNELFKKVLPNYEEKHFKTKSGKSIDVSGDNTKNKLSAIVETMTGKADKNTLVGSNILYLVDLINNICDFQSKGVHNDVTREAAEECVILTYITLGRLLDLFYKFEKQ